MAFPYSSNLPSFIKLNAYLPLDDFARTNLPWGAQRTRSFEHLWMALDPLLHASLVLTALEQPQNFASTADGVLVPVTVSAPSSDHLYNLPGSTMTISMDDQPFLRCAFKLYSRAAFASWPQSNSDFQNLVNLVRVEEFRRQFLPSFQ